ncbi:MAG: hypothetical protein ABJO86_19200 [Lentilitoribacter sp.]
MLQSISSKVKSLKDASNKNSTKILEDIANNRDDYKNYIDVALTLATANSMSIQTREELVLNIQNAASLVRALKHYAFDLLPPRRLEQFAKLVSTLSDDEIRKIAVLINQRIIYQTAILKNDITSGHIAEMAYKLRLVDTDLAHYLAGSFESAMTRVNNKVTIVLVNMTHALIQPIGWAAEQIARPMMASTHWITGGKVTRIIGQTIHGFLSRESLAKTGLETSWGTRFIVPGTVGFIGNAGPWVMLYTGQIRDYQAMSVPFRINPGATLATDVATLTINRPGFGAGSATPIASGYVDSARSKLLIGRDGVLYVRVGIWEGRGAYFTISAFIPLLPWMHITWNASLFSPGWEPLVRWSHPFTIWVRGQADWIWTKIKKPFAFYKRK